jgi:hypothetical protein
MITCLTKLLIADPPGAVDTFYFVTFENPENCSGAIGKLIAGKHQGQSPDSLIAADDCAFVKRKAGSCF